MQYRDELRSRANRGLAWLLGVFVVVLYVSFILLHRP